MIPYWLKISSIWRPTHSKTEFNGQESMKCWLQINLPIQLCAKKCTKKQWESLAVIMWPVLANDRPQNKLHWEVTTHTQHTTIAILWMNRPRDRFSEAIWAQRSIWKWRSIQRRYSTFEDEMEYMKKRLNQCEASGGWIKENIVAHCETLCL